MKYILATVLVCSTAIAFSQSEALVNFNRLTINNWNGKYFQVGPYMVKGSPYLFGQSFNGSLNFVNGTQEKEKKIFYDIYNQKTGLDANEQFLEFSAPVKSFTIALPADYGGSVLTFHQTSDFGSDVPKGYFAVLAEGSKGKFFKYYKATLMADPVNQMDKQARAFEQLLEYYLYNNTTNEIHKIKLREKDILKEFNTDKSLKEFIEKNRFDLSKEEGMIQFINGYK